MQKMTLQKGERSMGPYEKKFTHEGRTYYCLFNLIYDAVEVLEVQVQAVYCDEAPEVDIQDPFLLGLGWMVANNVADILHKKATA
jgi:hypothetical protein